MTRSEAGQPPSGAPEKVRRIAVPGYAVEPGQMDELVVELFPRRSALSAIMEMVEKFGETHCIPDWIVYKLNLEIDELLTNYVVHRRSSHAAPRMVIRVRLVGPDVASGSDPATVGVGSGRARAVLIMADTGPPFDPQTVPAPDMPAAEDLRVGGAGLHLVRRSATRMHYREIDGCNILRLEHDIEPESVEVDE